MSLRFHLDEHVSQAAGNGLRRHGIDVTTSQEAGLLGHDDREQLTFEVSQGRVLVTNDHHFTMPVRRISDHPGICYCPLDKYSARELPDCLLVVAGYMTHEEMKNRLEYL